MLRKNLIFSFGALVFLSSPAAHAMETFVFTQAELGFAQLEGRDFRTGGVRTGALVELLPYLRTGLSVGGVSGTQETSLFDNFLGYDVSAELASVVTLGSWQPFVSFRVPIHSDFGATGDVNDHPVNITEGSTSSRFIVKRDDGTTGGSYFRSGQLTRDYKLKGSIQGTDLAIGTGYALTENLALTFAAGYTARTMTIRSSELEGSRWSDVRWDFDQQHGLRASDNGSGSQIKPDRKSRFFGGSSFSLGMSYRI